MTKKQRQEKYSLSNNFGVNKVSGTALSSFKEALTYPMLAGAEGNPGS